MSRPFAVFDIDGTLIRWQMYHAIFDALATDAAIDPQTYDEIRNARMRWKRRAHAESFKEYEHSLVQAYQAVLTTLSIKQFERAIDQVFEEYKDQTYTFTRELIKQLKVKNYLLLAISGSQSEIVGRVANYYGFDDFVGEQQERVGERFSGRVGATVHNKGAILKELVAKHKVGFAKSIGVGDGLSDVGILELVEQPIAFNPEQKLFSVAKERGWKIVVERKNMIYELKSTHGQYVLD